MKKSLKLAALISTVAALSACGTMGGGNSAGGYAVSPSGNAVKSGSGLCWRTATWTKEQATEECDPDLVPKKAVIAAPAPAPAARAGGQPAALDGAVSRRSSFLARQASRNPPSA